MVVVSMGIDIGQRRDPTAIAVAELAERARHPGGHDEGQGGDRVLHTPCTHLDDHWLIRFLDRLPLGTSYPAVVQRIVSIRDGVRQQARGGELVIYLDSTGVGTPILDLLHEAGAAAQAVFFVHGERRSVTNGEIRLGKAWMVSRLQALLQSDRLHLPETPEARQLAKELLDYEIRVDDNAHDLYGAFRVGTHDDLVTALGLAVHHRPNLVRFY